MEAGSNLCRTLGRGIFYIPHPWIKQLHVSDLPSHPCDPNGYLDQSESLLSEEGSAH